MDYNKESLNLVNSISKAKPLYKKLILLAHPDKHPEKTELATLLSQKLNLERYNYNKLLELEEEIQRDLA